MTATPLLVRARALTHFADLVAALGGDARAWLDEAGISDAMLNEPESALSMPVVVALLERAAARLDVPDLGLRLAQLQDFSVLGPIALAARRAPTLGAALAIISRNLPYHVARTSLYLEPGHAQGQSCLRYELPAAAGQAQRQTVEMCCLLLVQGLRMLCAESLPGLTVVFAHAPAVSAARYRALFACPVKFRQSGHGVLFPTELLARPIDGGNAQISAAAERFVSHLVRRKSLDLASQIEELIARQLASGGCSLPDIARQLAMHERTLQRRLDAQQVRFADLVDRVRRNQAREFLAQAALPLHEVASLLGYSEQRSLSRACQRWFATTPAGYRNAR